MQVVPAIIPFSKSELEEEINKVSKFAKLVQIDISDGIFTPIKTWPYNDDQEIKLPQNQDVKFEIHLMVQQPENVLLNWIHTRASAIVAHIEATDNFQKVIDICRENNVSVGVAIKPSTNIEKIKPFVEQVYPIRDREGSQRESISNGVDFIQVMGSDILGKHGVELDPKAVDMIKTLRKIYPESIISIDIGVNLDTKNELISAGATKLISGGLILNSDNPEQVFNNLKSFSPKPF